METRDLIELNKSGLARRPKSVCYTQILNMLPSHGYSDSPSARVHHCTAGARNEVEGVDMVGKQTRYS